MAVDKIWQSWVFKAALDCQKMCKKTNIMTTNEDEQDKEDEDAKYLDKYNDAVSKLVLVP